jgi:hypothetical protein
MTALFYVVIWGHAALALIFGDLFCHYRALKYYSNVEYPPNRLHAKILFLRAGGVIFSTDCTHFRDRTQKLTRQPEVEGHTTQTPSKIVSGRRACSQKTGP